MPKQGVAVFQVHRVHRVHRQSMGQSIKKYHNQNTKVKQVKIIKSEHASGVNGCKCRGVDVLKNDLISRRYIYFIRRKMSR